MSETKTRPRCVGQCPPATSRDGQTQIGRDISPLANQSERGKQPANASLEGRLTVGEKDLTHRRHEADGVGHDRQHLWPGMCAVQEYKQKKAPCEIRRSMTRRRQDLNQPLRQRRCVFEWSGPGVESERRADRMVSLGLQPRGFRHKERNLFARLQLTLEWSYGLQGAAA